MIPRKETRHVVQRMSKLGFSIGGCLHKLGSMVPLTRGSVDVSAIRGSLGAIRGELTMKTNKNNPK